MPRFFVSKEDIQGKIIVVRKDAHHLVHVLRVRRGEKLTVSDAQGMDYLCEVMDISKGEEEVLLKILSGEASKTESPVRLKLYQALPKNDKMEWILQKGTEIGIDTFIPFISERVISRPDVKSQKKKNERWIRVCEAASKQSGRGKIPSVEPVLSFSEVLSQVKARPQELSLLCYEEEKAVSMKKALQEISGRGEKLPECVSIFIGPEGGFSEAEARELREAGAIPVTLGPRILRTETAGAVAAVQVLYEFEL